MRPTPSRRETLAMLCASIAASGCESVIVDVENKIPLDESGIEPISTNDRFYVYQCCGQPELDPESWEMAILVDGVEVARIDRDYFDTLEPIELEHTLQCIGGNPRNPLINNSVWGGLPFIDILDDLGVDVPPATVDLKFVGADDYHTGVPVEDLVEERMWLVWQMNGQPLPFDHGAPCRFLVQNRYGTKNVKWPVTVDLLPREYRGYWELTGWSDEATYRQNGFILQPVDGTVLYRDVGDVVEMYGTAHAGSDPVTRVEITFDDGASWEDVDVYYSPGANIWTLWKYVIESPSGSYEARIRVTTQSGKVTNGPDGTGQSAGYDGGMRIRFEVKEP